MRIVSINMNDFGGTNNHLMEHKVYNAWVGRECIDWKYWSLIDKRNVFDMFLRYIKDKKPDVLIINEMIISPLEKIDFISQIRKQGFSCFEGNIPKGKFSFTMMFFRNVECSLLISSNKGYRENRSILYYVSGINIKGTHFPQESDEKFLVDVENFCRMHCNDKVIIMGDLNANDPSRGNKQLVEKLISNGYKDVWLEKGNPADISTELRFGGRLDYVLASASAFSVITNVQIDPYTMESGMTDHATLIVDLNV